MSIHGSTGSPRTDFVFYTYLVAGVIIIGVLTVAFGVWFSQPELFKSRMKKIMSPLRIIIGSLFIAGIIYLVQENIRDKLSIKYQRDNYVLAVKHLCDSCDLRIKEKETYFEQEKAILQQKAIEHDKKQSKKTSKSIDISTQGNNNSFQNQGIIANSVDVAVNTDRRLTKESADLLINGLNKNQCQIIVGAIGMGGENDYLANQLLSSAIQAGCKASGVMHGIGRADFLGLRILYSPINTPTKTISVIENALSKSHISYQKFADPSQADGAIYLYVGIKP